MLYMTRVRTPLPMRFATLLLAAAVLSSVVGAHAARIIDQNSDGLDDVWEARLTTPKASTPTPTPTATATPTPRKPLAGTDPRDAASHPPTVSIAVGNGNFVTLTWNTVTGKAIPHANQHHAGGQRRLDLPRLALLRHRRAMSATFGINPARPQYYRVQFGDMDSDGDGVSDWDELRLGFDPFRADTFNTGFGDRQTILTALAAVNTINVTADARRRPARPTATPACSPSRARGNFIGHRRGVHHRRHGGPRQGLRHRFPARSCSRSRSTPSGQRHARRRRDVHHPAARSPSRSPPAPAIMVDPNATPATVTLNSPARRQGPGRRRIMG